jgi:hypothetical protein
VYSSEYTEIQKVFFTLQHRMWRQQVASLITAVQINCWLTSLLLERNNKGNNGIKGHCYDIVIRGHCESTMISVLSVEAMCSNNDLGSHCRNNVFQQWSWVVRGAQKEGKMRQTNPRQTWTSPIGRSSLTLEREDHLTRRTLSGVWTLNPGVRAVWDRRPSDHAATATVPHGVN